MGFLDERDLKPGGISPKVMGRPVYNGSGGSLAAYTVVRASTWQEGTSNKVMSVVAADANAADPNVTGFVGASAIASAAYGRIYSAIRSTATLNTNGATVGDPVYLSETAGGWTLTAPVADNAVVRIIGRVAVVSATVGVIEFDADIEQMPTSIGNQQVRGLAAGAVANLANAAVIGGIPVLFRIDIADAAGDTNVVSTHKIRIVDFWFHNTGIAAHATDDTIQLKNGATAITAVLPKTATVEATVRATTMVAAQLTIAAGGTIRITAAKSTNAAVTAYVLAYRIA